MNAAVAAASDNTVKNLNFNDIVVPLEFYLAFAITYLDVCRVRLVVRFLYASAKKCKSGVRSIHTISKECLLSFAYYRPKMRNLGSSAL